MPGIPTIVEGLTYALAGLLFGWGIYSLFKTVLTFPFKTLASKSKNTRNLKYLGKHYQKPVKRKVKQNVPMTPIDSSGKARNSL